MILFCCLYASLFSSPTHHNCIRSKAPFEYLIPPYQSFSFAVYIFLHPLNEVTLQFMFVFQVIVFNSLLAIRTTLPIVFWTFITSGMNILTGKKRNYFINHILQKLKRGIFSGTEHIIKNAPCFLNKFSCCFLTCFRNHVVGNLCFFLWEATQERIRS